MSSTRAGLRFAASFRQQFARSFKRNQTTATNPAAEAAHTAPPPQSLFQRLWTSEVGIKTVHFWAPIMKWGVVAAGASDFLRPAEKLSLTQNMALLATGSIWTRWCFVIRPQNMLLAGVNFCLFLVGLVQTSRIFMYQKEKMGSSGAAVEEMWAIVKGDSKKAEKKLEQEAKKAEDKIGA